MLRNIIFDLDLVVLGRGIDEEIIDRRRGAQYYVWTTHQTLIIRGLT